MPAIGQRRRRSSDTARGLALFVALVLALMGMLSVLDRPSARDRDHDRQVGTSVWGGRFYAVAQDWDALGGTWRVRFYVINRGDERATPSCSIFPEGGSPVQHVGFLGSLGPGERRSVTVGTGISADVPGERWVIPCGDLPGS